MSQIKKETRTVSGFDSLILKGKGELLLTQGGSESVVLEGDDELLSRVNTEVKDGLLTISFKSWLDHLLPPSSLKIYVTLKNVHGIRIAGSGTLHAAKIVTDRLKLETSGSADMKIDDLTADDLEVALSGTGEFDIAGKVTAQDVQVSGSGKYNTRNLESQIASVQVSGSCDITVNTIVSLELRVSGSALVSYVGNPRLKQRVTGHASIQRIE